MTYTYHITGMTCNGCRSHVEKQLRDIPGVTDAAVDLEQALASLTMPTLIATKHLQAALSSKYKITATTKTEIDTTLIKNLPNKTSEKSSIQQLYPLFLILGYMTIAAILLNRIEGGVSGFMLDFMGLFYIIFSFFKILGLRGFPNSFGMYDPLAKVVPLYGWVYPFIETALGLCFLMRFEITVALIATIIILGITTIGVAKALLNKETIQCACLGTVLQLPMTKATLIENTIMLVMALWMLSSHYLGK